MRTALTWIAAAALLAGFARLAADTPWPLFATALLPAALAAAAVVRLDRHAHAPRRLLFGAFLWGAVVAPAAALALNEVLRGWIGEVAGPTEAVHLTGAFAAPAVEEIAKAAALAILAVVWRRDLRGVVDGIVFGALIGIGFTMAENLYYFALAAVGGGSAGLAESVYLRAALGGLLHPTFTATTGAGLGWARGARRGIARLAGPLVGLGLAILQHVAWNTAPWLDAATCGGRGRVRPGRAPALLAAQRAGDRAALHRPRPDRPRAAGAPRAPLRPRIDRRVRALTRSGRRRHEGAPGRYSGADAIVSPKYIAKSRRPALEWAP
jgi:RsiW-degrading membrane proteinase PrsW (M82 family)